MTARSAAGTSNRPPRGGMLEWDGHRWAPSGVADGHATAAQETDQQSEAERVRLPPFGRLPGTDSRLVIVGPGRARPSYLPLCDGPFLRGHPTQ